MIVVDASVVIALLEPHDGHHDRAVALVGALLDETDAEIALHPLTAAEILAGFVPSGGERAAWEDLADVGFSIRGLPDDAESAFALARLRVTSRLKMPDVVVLATALLHGAGLATFDDALRRAAIERDVTLAG